MSVRTELWGLTISGTLCWIGFGLTVVNTNPGLGTAPLVSFYISLFVGVLAAMTLLGYGLRRYLAHNEVKYEIIRTAFRQGFLLAILLVVLLWLQATRLLAWWDILVLIAVAGLVEMYIRSYARS